MKELKFHPISISNYFRNKLVSNILNPKLGASTAKWSSHSTFEHWYTMPWAVSFRLGDNILFSDPSTTSIHYFMISI